MQFLNKKDLNEADKSFDDQALSKWDKYCTEAKLHNESEIVQFTTLEQHLKNICSAPATENFKGNPCCEMTECCPPHLDLTAERAKIDYLKIINLHLRMLASRPMAGAPEGWDRQAEIRKIQNREGYIEQVKTVLTNSNRSCSSDGTLFILTNLTVGGVVCTASFPDLRLVFGILLAICALMLAHALKQRCSAAISAKPLSELYDNIANPSAEEEKQENQQAAIFRNPANAFRLGEVKEVKSSEAKSDQVAVDIQTPMQQLQQPLLDGQAEDPQIEGQSGEQTTNMNLLY